MRVVSAILSLLLVASPAFAQSGAQCPPPSQFPGRPYFDFQVEVPVIYLGTDSARIKPTQQHATPPFPEDFALAQFVVDSLGVPMTSSLKLLVQPSALMKEDVISALGEWRYQPARVGGCKVPQLVQTPLRWK